MPIDLPTGTVTFLFSDIEGSTKRWDNQPDTMRVDLARHDELMREAVAKHDGRVFKTIGDAFCVVFHTAPDAVRAGLHAQLALAAEPWVGGEPMKVRMAIHTGAAELRDMDYFGQPLNRVARLLSTGHGGQVLVSRVAYDLTIDSLPAPLAFRSLGEHRLKDLGRPESIFQLLHPDLPAEFPPLRSLDTTPNNLPQQLTSFVGREKELAEIKSQLKTTRLLTLTGPGGAGKTRLSLQVAVDLLEGSSDGVWLVELAALTEPELVLSTVADAMNLRGGAGKMTLDRLADALREKRAVLILDNCEHLIESCAELADAILRRCPEITIIASSRERLGIGGELIYRVPSLTSPTPSEDSTPGSISEFEAVRLFVERAIHHRPDFEVTNGNAPALASICFQLDGIPLAIELAAARTRSLSIEEIHSKLDTRFRLLTGGARTALPRQQTLRSLIDWSYDLLDPKEKLLMCRLAVFAGGWSLAAVEAVCSDAAIDEWEILDLLQNLVDKSLVTTEERVRVMRYRMLETIRRYALDRLSESEEGARVRSRHRDFFLSLVEEIEPKLKGAEQGKQFSILTLELDNLRAAIAFCLEDPEGAVPGLQFGRALSTFWVSQTHFREGEALLSRLLSRPEAAPRTQLRGEALIRLGTLNFCLSNLREARANQEDGLEIAREVGDRRSMAVALNGLGNVAVEFSEYPVAVSLYEESVALFRELRDQLGTAAPLLNLGRIAYQRGEYETARSRLLESLAINRSLGDSYGIGKCLYNLAISAYYEGDKESARTYADESLALRREMGDRQGVADSLSVVAAMAGEAGDKVGELRMLEEGLALQRELGSRWGIAAALVNVATRYRADGNWESANEYAKEGLAILLDLGDIRGISDGLDELSTAAAGDKPDAYSVQLWAAALSLRESTGTVFAPQRTQELEAALASAREALGEERFTQAWDLGRAMSAEEAVAFALG